MRTPPFPSKEIEEALARVEDPEIGFSIVELGLVRGVVPLSSGKGLKVYLTLTSPMCPMGPEIVESCRLALLGLEGVEEAEVELVWDPPWDPRVDPTEEIRAEFGFWE